MTTHSHWRDRPVLVTGATGFLGLPTGTEVLVGAKRRQSFEGGAIEYEPGQGATLRLPDEALNPFLGAINDYRLLQAARHQVGEAEMERHLDEDAAQLSPTQRVALLEIHFLAWLIEELLRAMHGR